MSYLYTYLKINTILLFEGNWKTYQMTWLNGLYPFYHSDLINFLIMLPALDNILAGNE